MMYCMWDNFLLYLCLNGCILKVSSSRDGLGVGGADVCDVRVHLKEEGVEVLGGSRVNYHNWSIPRVSSSRKWTGQGLSSSKQEHFFAPKSSSKRSFFLFKVTTDG